MPSNMIVINGKLNYLIPDSYMETVIGMLDIIKQSVEAQGELVAWVETEKE